VDTPRLKRTQQPAHVDRLLQGLIKHSGLLPGGAVLLSTRRELPEILHPVILRAAREGLSWSCWLDGEGHVWLFTGEMSLPLSRERGAPVLQINHYREDGELKEIANWVNSESRWRRCSAG
jgi:hypothetical protein